MAGNAAVLRLYTSPVPAPGASIGSADLLCEITLGNPLGAITSDASYYILTLADSTPDSYADADGVAAWARITSSDGDWIGDFDVTATGNGGAITIKSTSVYAGGTVTLMSGVIKVAK